MHRKLVNAIHARRCLVYWDDDRPWLWLEADGVCEAHGTDEEGFDILLYALRIHGITIWPSRPYTNF